MSSRYLAVLLAGLATMIGVSRLAAQTPEDQPIANSGRCGQVRRCTQCAGVFHDFRGARRPEQGGFRNPGQVCARLRCAVSLAHAE